MKRLIKKTLNRLGYDVVSYVPPEESQFKAVRDLPDDEREILRKVKPFTMTSVESVASLINAVSYITKNKIEGDVAECGVWRGGSMMTVALTLLAHNDTSRELFLYDTFEGMTEPAAVDTRFDGVPAKTEMEQQPGKWCYASVEDVRENILSTGYPEKKIHLVRGKVEETIPEVLPTKLSLLRLDTDWYESTKHELVHLSPLLSPDAVLIIDDYGHWQGSRKAVDEYFAEQNRRVYLHRIDYSGRVAVGINKFAI